MFLLALFVALLSQAAVPAATITLTVTTEGTAVAGARIAVGDATYETSTNGTVRIPVAAALVQVTVTKDGFVPVTTSVPVAAGQDRAVVVELEKQPSLEETVTVSATRTESRIEDEPMRVEVLDRQDLEEEQAQTPGDVVMVLNEKSGIRVQATAPGLGAATIRMQGMRGRYTRVLSDGLPLFGDDVGGLSLLQTPPADLERIEIIKGVASALYGAGALAGVIDLVSRRPGAKADRHVLVNESSIGNTDTVLYAAQPLTGGWSGSIVTGGHWERRGDVDGDGWADIAGYSRGLVRPRVYWDDGSGNSVFATGAVMWEQRRGGTVDGAALPATGAAFGESLQTTRVDGGVVAQRLLARRYVLTGRASFTREHQDHVFGPVDERNRDQTIFGEVALRGTAGAHTWVGGVAYERNVFEPEALPRFGYRYSVPGLFAQDEIAIRRWLTVSASGRIDVHNVFGTFASPRVSALVQHAGWTARGSYGTGFFAPTPLTEETQAAGLARLNVPVPLGAERGRSSSIDVTRTAGPVSVTATLFHSRVADPVVLDRATYTLRNLATPTVNTGTELLGVWRRDPFTVTTTYTYVRSREGDGADRGDVPLTPRHSVGVFGSWEEESWGRVTLEWYYTGVQRLEDNPYRTRSAPYVVFGALVERRIGHLNLFVNAENLGNVRQTQWDPLLRPHPAADGQWTVDGWAPLDGRVVNGGIRWRF